MLRNEISNQAAAARSGEALHRASATLLRLALSAGFIGGALVYALTGLDGEPNLLLAVAAAFGAYMAMNVGANDVANNVGPAVGAKAMTLGFALVVAAVFEAAGALIAGGDVVETIRSDIVDPKRLAEGGGFVWAMMAALLAAALWLNIASAFGAPISATHSIVGAIVGAGIAARGTAAIDWSTMGSIMASWLISPLLGGVIAAAFLYAVKRCITYQSDMMQAARRHVPVLVALMAWAFASYLLLKGLHRVWALSVPAATASGLALALAVYGLVRRSVARCAGRLPNDKGGVNRLFTLPLVFSAGLLSFAHGSNDVANAIGPLVAIIDVLLHGDVVAQAAAIPWWVMVMGALGISIGLLLYGPRVIRTVSNEITELDPMRAYCIAMAATSTVIVASQLGLPVSTTHIAVGAVFGVGLLREAMKAKHMRLIRRIEAHHADAGRAAVEALIERFHATPLKERAALLAQLDAESRNRGAAPRAVEMQRHKSGRQRLVKRSLMLGIVATWVITVPASTLLGALLYYMLRGMLLA